MEFYIDDVINKINKTLEEKGQGQKVQVTKVNKPEWDFDHMNSMKEQLIEDARKSRIEKIAKTIDANNFTVISDERLKNLLAKERVLAKLTGGLTELFEDFLDVIGND